MTGQQISLQREEVCFDHGLGYEYVIVLLIENILIRHNEVYIYLFCFYSHIKWWCRPIKV